MKRSRKVIANDLVAALGAMEKKKAARIKKESKPWDIDTGLIHVACGGKIIEHKVPYYGPPRTSCGSPVIGFNMDDAIHFHERNYQGHVTEGFSCRNCGSPINEGWIEKHKKRKKK